MTGWNQLPAGIRRLLTVGTVATLVLGVAWGLGSLVPSGDDAARRRQVNEAILTDADTRQATIDTLAARLTDAQANHQRLAESYEELRAQQARLVQKVVTQFQREMARGDAGNARDWQREITALRAEFAELADLDAVELPAATQIEPPASASKTSDAAPESSAEAPLSTDTESVPEAKPSEALVTSVPGTLTFPEQDQPADLSSQSVFRQWPAPPAESAPSPPANNGAMEPDRPASSIRIITAANQGQDGAGDGTSPEHQGEVFRLPSGSILTGTLITGLDAPTASQARREPFPVLVRLKKTAILPNRFQTDVRECFTLLAAYGDLSSERAYMRGETMSCVLDDGTVVEQRLEGYAAGEDGKAGARGRVVRKEGQFIARALAVGFLEAAGQALGGGRNVVQLGVSDGSSYVDGAEQSAGSVAIAGAGNALGRVADWYIQQAFNLFPVIEIDAGREIDVVLTALLEMRLPVGDG
ncbi:MAG: hypothetical protein OET79_04995 [Nitrospirota bacterium]|nr:hypothetical protein [Nitrospirota bacterium]